MTGNVRQTPPEPTCGTLWVTSDSSPTRDGTGPQNASEGTGDMNSIDNLREYVLTAPSICSTTRAILVGYVDDIDREVAEVRDRDYRNGVEDAKGAVEFADRLKAAVDEREDVTLFGVDYTPLELVKEHLANRCMTLPLDADGEPWHINDEFEVDEGIAHVNGIGDNRLFYIDGDGMQWTRADNKLHHHAPTVEDVLREFTRDWCNAACAGDMTNTERDAVRANTIAEYAAKLRLAGEDA